MMLFASNLEPQLFGPLGGMLILGIVAVSIVGLNHWKKIRITEMEATLKQQMLDRGMSADEIIRVLAASCSKAPTSQSGAANLSRETADYSG